VVRAGLEPASPYTAADAVESLSLLFNGFASATATE
jgi:hypothetical protein